MVSDRFGVLLEEVGKALNIPLKPDANNSCLIKYPDDIQIQIELERKLGEDLILGTDFGEIPVGKYREDLFLEALKWNGMPLPRYGIFAYSKPTGHLVLFEKFPLGQFSPEKFIEYLPLFIAKTKIWKEALANGRLPILVASESAAGSHSSGGLFGLRP